MMAVPDKKITLKVIEDITHRIMDASRPTLKGQCDASKPMVEGLEAESQIDAVRCLIDLVEEKSDQVANLLEQLEYVHKAYSQQIINCNALVRQNHELTKRLTTQFTKV